MRPDSIDRREQFNQAPPVVPDFEAEAARLAQLPPHEYDRCRTKAAECLEVRVPTLDAEVMKHRPKSTSADGADNGIMFPKLEPWPDPVDGGALLVKLFNAINRFVILPDGAAETIGLWVVQAHAHDAAEHSPLLAFTSPEKRSGKTTALRVLQPLVPRPLPTSNITTAALFRSIEMWRPTLLVDEADSFLGDNDELRGVLNSGHCRDQAFLIRSVGDDHTPTRFNTWGPKVVALIGSLPDTLEDRAIGIAKRAWRYWRSHCRRQANA